MSSPLPDGMMRPRGGGRITVRPEPDQFIAAVVVGITVKMTIDESRQLRDMLQAAELRAARGDVIT